MKTKHLFIILAIIFIVALFIVPWVVKGIMLVLAVTILMIYFGKEKVLKVSGDFLGTVFDSSKKKLDEMTSRNTEETLTIHDVEQEERSDGTFVLSIFTEKGKMTLKPRRFAAVPQVLKKGKKVVYKVVHTMENCKIVKQKTISAVGEDGEERIFQLEE